MALFNVSFRELVGEDVARELEHTYGRVGGYLLEEHNDEGNHTDITADSIVVPLATIDQITGPVRVIDQVTFDQLIVAKSAVLSPTTLSGNQNNWDPTDTSFPLRTLADVTVLRIDATAARDITGIAAPATVFEMTTGTPEQQQRLMVLVNRSDYTITLKHSSSSSTSANRFDCPGQVDFKLLKRACAWVWYDSGSAVWRVVSQPALDYGTYTPTITNGSNVAASTPGACQYMQVGSTVTVSGSCAIDPTADATITKFEMTLPIESDLASEGQLAGTMMTQTSTVDYGPIYGNTSSHEAQFDWTTHNTGNHALFFHFTYQVV